ncbi:efflux RND transporter periplasmic adaptor subunit [Azohydromonas caseinilytica]|uniref:HlyD family efflux transporter periplasmic adaptor subunit n=1 Tax=Azohydromonas caseinilytica TaxID=2728836 RepID=A0A848F8L0_9BURK|nr:efflux RND transporter periplasmic adaptor subunit [Azohydromonas caseinilytica]NML15558.1 HlyD family efflux transporter periplasmic adaptor subunit [Azohydromonas caseinilytica]
MSDSKEQRLRKRKKGLTIIGAVVLVGGLAWGGWHLAVASRYETTDNAYVQADVVQVTPQLAGTVQQVLAQDTDFVRAGQPLVRLDAADARVALEQAQAALAQTVREVRTLYANSAAQQAQVALRQADAERARAELARTQDDVRRREPLLASGAVGREEFNHVLAQRAAAQAALAAAESAVRAAREQLASSQALTDNTPVAEHPNVLRAAARVREAHLALQRTELAAPVDGYVARRSVQVGQRVQAGAPLMSVVTLGQSWVDANFKEVQLRKLRIGQPVTLEADVYGGKVEYHGRVVGLGAGTGAAFALLPAQNATGNWIKVVQRVPVRIELNAEELKAHPLRVGLSMEATVDVRDQSGKVLADAPRPAPAAASAPEGAGGAAEMTPQEREAQADVQRIIAANLGAAVRGAVPAAATVPSAASRADTTARVASAPARAAVAQ